MTDDAVPVGERRQLAPPTDDSGALGWMRLLYASKAQGASQQLTRV